MRSARRPHLAQPTVTCEHGKKLFGSFKSAHLILSRVLGRGFYSSGGYANCANYPPALKATGPGRSLLLGNIAVLSCCVARHLGYAREPR
jgi:hypothetical protein